MNAGDGNLPATSIALLDQVRSIDSTRVIRYIGTLPPELYQPIAEGLEQMMKPAI
jgi:mRNA interferase MazF